MLTKRGIPVSPGVVCGPALVLGVEDFRIPQRYVGVDAVETEISRFQAALSVVCDEIAENESLATKTLGKQYGAIFGAHLQMVQDPKLIDEIFKLVRERHFSPEFACSRVFRRYAKMFQNLGNRYLADRADDIFDLEKRILRHLLGARREELMHLTEPVIVLANNLTPGETATLPKEFVLGFATQLGGRTSHTAILAGALEIPAVVGLGDFLSDVSAGESVIIDGTRGEIIIDPDEETLRQYRASQVRAKSVVARLESLRQEPSVTRDQVRILLLGNIEFPEEVEHCTQRGADGIGLYRTEFLYLRGGPEPTEEDHVAAYRKVVSAFNGHEVVIRTLDLGADKFPSEHKSLSSTASASALGLRSIRLALQNLALFKTQLRAILRAAVAGNAAIMFPLVSSLLELRQAKMILEDVKEDLEEEGVAFKRDVPVGMMVEVPSAALLADEFAQRGRLLLDRYQRSDPVHAGRRSIRPRSGEPLQFRRPFDLAADSPRGRGGAKTQYPRDGLRTDEFRSQVHSAVDRNGDPASERDAAFDPRSEVGHSLDRPASGRGNRLPGDGARLGTRCRKLLAR